MGKLIGSGVSEIAVGQTNYGSENYKIMGNGGGQTTKSDSMLLMGTKEGLESRD